MENNTFKSVAFGGFDKQDVISYIEKTAKAAAAEQEKLQQENERVKLENEALQKALAEAQEQLSAAQSELASVGAQAETLRAELEQEAALRKSLEAWKAEAEQLAADVERLRPDAAAYAQFREKIGAIECEARKRAADLEEATQLKLQKIVDEFQQQYAQLMSTFTSTSAYVNSELRKVEVNLTQLPRALDKNGIELKELAAILERSKDAE